MPTRVLLAVAGLAGFVSYCFYRGQCTHAVKREVKEDLHRWEGEGGNLPTVATPSPFPVPQPSVSSGPSIH